MGRLRIPDSWRIVRDKEDGRLLCIQPTAQPSYSRKSRYEVIGNLEAEEDAIQFLQYKELGLNCDAIAFLLIEHQLHKTGENQKDLDMEQVENMSQRVRRERGRECFGGCQSMERKGACAICYSDLRDTWKLCATIKILSEMQAITEGRNPH